MRVQQDFIMEQCGGMLYLYGERFTDMLLLSGACETDKGMLDVEKSFNIFPYILLCVFF